jgi:predicted O-methyltransferase YrrM
MKDEFYVMRTPEQREGLEQMIEWINNVTPTSQMRIIEIGSYVGESTLMFAQNFKEVVYKVIRVVPPDSNAYNLNLSLPGYGIGCNPNSWQKFMTLVHI